MKVPVPTRSQKLSSNEPGKYLADYRVTTSTVNNLKPVHQTKQSLVNKMDTTSGVMIN